MNKYILATDSFKGCLTSAEVEKAAEIAIKHVEDAAEIISVPMSDGGEGMLNAVLNSLKGERVTVPVHDLLMRKISAEYGIFPPDGNKIKSKTAIIETANVIGISLINGEANNILAATSYGVGEIIMDAISKGCGNFIIGLGGSATSDCGIGMLRALIKVSHKSNFDEIRHLFQFVNFTIACDVNAPLYGDNGAARVFATQKGATQQQVDLLERRAKTFSEMSAKHFGHDCSREAGAGAAGGLGYAFMQYLGAKAQSGADFLLDIINFDDYLRGATRVITGEGRADKQTLMGKLPYQIMRRAKRYNVPTLLIAGKVEDDKVLLEAGFDKVQCINVGNIDIKEALKSSVATRNIITTVERSLS